MLTKIDAPPQATTSSLPSGGLWCCANRCGKLIPDDAPYVRIRDADTGKDIWYACSPACADEIIRENSPDMCLVPGCARPMKGGSRGLCANHYIQAYHAVRSGKTTWEAMEQAGMALPARKSKLQLPR